jgi:hypothetical protein
MEAAALFGTLQRRLLSSLLGLGAGDDEFFGRLTPGDICIYIQASVAREFDLVVRDPGGAPLAERLQLPHTAVPIFCRYRQPAPHRGCCAGSGAPPPSLRITPPRVAHASRRLRSRPPVLRLTGKGGGCCVRTSTGGQAGSSLCGGIPASEHHRPAVQVWACPLHPRSGNDSWSPRCGCRGPRAVALAGCDGALRVCVCLCACVVVVRQRPCAPWGRPCGHQSHGCIQGCVRRRPACPRVRSPWQALVLGDWSVFVPVGSYACCHLPRVYTCGAGVQGPLWPCSTLFPIRTTALRQWTAPSTCSGRGLAPNVTPCAWAVCDPSGSSQAPPLGVFPGTTTPLPRHHHAPFRLPSRPQRSCWVVCPIVRAHASQLRTWEVKDGCLYGELSTRKKRAILGFRNWMAR